MLPRSTHTGKKRKACKLAVRECKQARTIAKGGRGEPAQPAQLNTLFTNLSLFACLFFPFASWHALNALFCVSKTCNENVKRAMEQALRVENARVPRKIWKQPSPKPDRGVRVKTSTRTCPEDRRMFVLGPAQVDVVQHMLSHIAAEHRTLVSNREFHVCGALRPDLAARRAQLDCQATQVALRYLWLRILLPRTNSWDMYNWNTMYSRCGNLPLEDAFVFLFPDKTYPRVKRLKIAFGKCTRPFADLVCARLPNLVEVNVKRAGDGLLIALGNCCERLRVVKCPHVACTDAGLWAIGTGCRKLEHFEAVESILTELTVLRLSDKIDVVRTKHETSSSWELFPSLRYANLSYARCLTPRGFELLFRPGLLSSLTKLKLQGRWCGHPGDRGLWCIANKLTKLKTLSLVNSQADPYTGYTYQGVNFLKKCPQFVGIALSGWDMRQWRIAEPLFAKLKVLRWKRAEHLNADLLCGLLRTMTRLQSLDIQHCNAVTDKVLEKAAEHMKRVVELKVGGCRNVTERYLRFLSDHPEHLPRLVRLQLGDEADGVRVSADEVHRFELRRTNVRVLK